MANQLKMPWLSSFKQQHWLCVKQCPNCFFPVSKRLLEDNERARKSHFNLKMFAHQDSFWLNRCRSNSEMAYCIEWGAGFSPGSPVFLPPQKPTLQIPIWSGNEGHRFLSFAFSVTLTKLNKVICYFPLTAAIFQWKLRCCNTSFLHFNFEFW